MMATPYVIATHTDDRPDFHTVIHVVDRRRPDQVVCACQDVNMARKIATALNRQHRDGATRRAAAR